MDLPISPLNCKYTCGHGMCVLTCACAQYELTLVASDGRNENSTRVIVRVLDVNDLPPRFTRSAYVTQALEETGPYPHSLIQVFCFFFLFCLVLFFDVDTSFNRHREINIIIYPNVSRKVTLKSFQAL